MSESQLKELMKYSACDVSDALLKILGTNGRAGHLTDIIPQVGNGKRLVGLISTANFVSNAEGGPASDIPKDKHWVDMVTPGSVLIQNQVEDHRNALLGGIMAARLRVLGVKGVITHGKIRDIDELEDIGLPVWSKGRSTVGQGLWAKCESVNRPITVAGIVIEPGDVCVADRNGVVVIPQSCVRDVLERLPKLVATDDHVLIEVKNGMSVKEAFARFR